MLNIAEIGGWSSTRELTGNKKRLVTFKTSIVVEDLKKIKESEVHVQLLAIRSRREGSIEIIFVIMVSRGSLPTREKVTEVFLTSVCSAHKLVCNLFRHKSLKRNVSKVVVTD